MACPTGKIVVESKDPRINYNLMPGEVLMTCPYNKSHALLPLKYPRHVLNCYRLHCKDQAAKGKEPLFKICQYDRSHHVLKEDLEDHEAVCDKRMPNDDWDDIGDSSSVQTKGKDPCGAGRSASYKVNLQEPPKIDEASMSAIRSENWEREVTYPTFDPRKRIHELRMQGYRVINSHDVIGMTKSEKKQFYKSEKDAMEFYSKRADAREYGPVPKKPKMVQPSVSANIKPTAERLEPIVEEEA